jgi:hypothetical protein
VACKKCETYLNFIATDIFELSNISSPSLQFFNFYFLLFFFPLFCIKIYNCKKLQYQLPIVIFSIDSTTVDVDNAEVSRVQQNWYPFGYHNVTGRLCSHRVTTCTAEFTSVFVRYGGVSREGQKYEKKKSYFMKKWAQIRYIINFNVIMYYDISSKMQFGSKVYVFYTL